MLNVSEYIASFGDFIELDLPHWDQETIEAVKNESDWIYYNRFKPGFNRWAIPLVSPDGSYNPDYVGSLNDYYRNTGNLVEEKDFKVKTPIVSKYHALQRSIDFWGEDVCRSHILKLDKGGFFPPHRDSTWVMPVNMFRIAIPLMNFGQYQAKWYLEDKALNFEMGKTYFINTSKIHHLFSFVDNAIIVILSVQVTDSSIKKLIAHHSIY